MLEALARAGFLMASEMPQYLKVGWYCWRAVAGCGIWPLCLLGIWSLLHLVLPKLRDAMPGHARRQVLGRLWAPLPLLPARHCGTTC